MSAWIVSPRLIHQLVYGAIRLGVIEQKNATAVGRMLTNANKKSIRARYGEDDAGAAAVKTYWYIQPYMPISDVSLRKQVAHYDYQTCEFDGYERSRAARFVRQMMATPELSKIDYDTPGYNEAPWGL